MGLRLNEMDLKYIANVFMNMYPPKERKAQQEIISDGRIIYQSDGNSETVDHVEHETSRRVSRLQSFNFGQVKTFMILVKSKSLVQSSLFL